ncbi:hypothetical protein COCON_G00004950 [Conger conger]|uniref:Uncharacterized protein n=1 Tax=Conger conger TaxID=82655 RepID=A0A9Q1I8H6_CONCO|nr:hypothetical protein COCON_G00004950 [Conger conger]
MPQIPELNPNPAIADYGGLSSGVIGQGVSYLLCLTTGLLAVQDMQLRRWTVGVRSSRGLRKRLRHGENGYQNTS